jgi:hypothetical protein
LGKSLLCILLVILVMSVQAQEIYTGSLEITPAHPNASWSAPQPLAPADSAELHITVAQSGTVNGRNYTRTAGPTPNFNPPSGSFVWTATGTGGTDFKVINLGAQPTNATVTVSATWTETAGGGGGGTNGAPAGIITGKATGLAQADIPIFTWNMDPRLEFADGSSSITYSVSGSLAGRRVIMSPYTVTVPSNNCTVTPNSGSGSLTLAGTITSTNSVKTRLILNYLQNTLTNSPNEIAFGKVDLIVPQGPSTNGGPPLPEDRQPNGGTAPATNELNPGTIVLFYHQDQTNRVATKLTLKADPTGGSLKLEKTGLDDLKIYTNSDLQSTPLSLPKTWGDGDPSPTTLYMVGSSSASNLQSAQGTLDLTYKTTLAADGIEQSIKDTVGVNLLPVSIAVDANRDGTIDFSGSDETSSTNPYRFWKNPQTTGTGTIQSSGNNGLYTPARPNDGLCNLDNFTRLNISVDDRTWGLIHDGMIQLALKWKSLTEGAPSLYLYRNGDDSGLLSYLWDSWHAENQIHGSNNQTIGIVQGNSPLSLNDLLLENYDNWNTIPLLFEATGIGSGQLELVFLDPSGTQIAEGPSVWMNLVDIKSMYQQWQATPTTLAPPYNDAVNPPADANNSGYQLMPARPLFQQALDETNSVFVFVNGSNESLDYSTTTAETVFKRLYWLGYRGRVISFRWETLVGLGDGLIPARYNLNEWMAWTWGEGLRKFIASSSIPSNYSKYVASHSLGAAVISSALQRGMTPDAVFFMQAALPAGCFDASGSRSDPNSVNGFADMWNKEDLHSTPDFDYELGYRGFVNTSVPIYNFYNSIDYALTPQGFNFGAWEGNQELYKPDSSTWYQMTSSWNYIYKPALSAGQQVSLVYSNTGNRFVITPYESMAFVARSRSKALGALSTGGIITENINVGDGSPTNLQNGRDDHGGEFHRPLNQVRPFYQDILDRIP